MVGAVAEQPPRPAARTAALAAHGRDRIHERQQFEDVVVVAAAQRERERRASSAGQRMVLGAAPGAVYWAWTGLLAPPTARTCEDRKSTRLNSSHMSISYAVFCLKKTTTTSTPTASPTPKTKQNYPTWHQPQSAG